MSVLPPIWPGLHLDTCATEAGAEAESTTEVGADPDSNPGLEPDGAAIDAGASALCLWQSAGNCCQAGMAARRERARIAGSIDCVDPIIF